jgi:uncharacterized membrane protein YdjX (TVP38/TMEM64 family)
VIVIATVTLATLVIEQSGLDSGLDELRQWVDREVRGHGLPGSLAFVVAGMAITAFGLSRQVLALLAGYAFGVAAGTGLALLATLGGCAIAFAYARFVGRDLVAHRYPARVRKVDEFLRVNPFLMTLAVRLLPIGNNLVTNLVAGVSSVAAAPFLAASAAGYLPQTIVFALVGSGVEQGVLAKSGVAAVLFVASALIGIYLYRRFRRGKSFDTDIDAALEAEDDPAVRTSGPERQL